MNCRIFDQDILRPCGKRCKDFKQVLLEISKTDQKDLLIKILDKLYFGRVGEPGQKKAIIITQNADLFVPQPKDRPLLVYALLNGTDNMEFIQLMEQVKNYVSGYGYNFASFDGIHLVVKTYNKCFCDSCVWTNLYRSWFLHTGYFYRVLVYEDFYFVFYQFFVRYKQGINLVQQAIETATPYFKCCPKISSREHASWLGDGADTTSSICALAPKKIPSPLSVTLHWDNLPLGTPWLLKKVSDDKLELFTPDGYIINAENFPKDILLYIDNSGDLLFIYNAWREDFIIIAYDSNYIHVKDEYP